MLTVYIIGEKNASVLLSEEAAFLHFSESFQEARGLTVHTRQITLFTLANAAKVWYDHT